MKKKRLPEDIFNCVIQHFGIHTFERSTVPWTWNSAWNLMHCKTFIVFKMKTKHFSDLNQKRSTHFDECCSTKNIFRWHFSPSFPNERRIFVSLFFMWLLIIRFSRSTSMYRKINIYLHTNYALHKLYCDTSTMACTKLLLA